MAARTSFAGLILLAAVAFGPAPAHALSYGEARHLLSRTGFGAALDEIRALEPLSRRQAVQRLISTTRTTAVTPPPDWADAPLRPRRKLRDMSDEERRQFRKKIRERAIDLQAWWLREMVDTPSPLTERMTLFWHNHFTSSLRKVKSPQLMFRQNALLRRHAMGSFRALVHEIARDPAMILYLDNITNRRGKPNENFARELLELFTLGEGHYSEQDIKEAARAFTGWTVNRRTGDYRFARRWHDGGEKRFMGRRGRLDGDDVIEIVLQQEQVAHHIARKLWRAFVSETPDAAAVARIAVAFRGSDYDIAAALEAALMTPEFWDPAHRGTLVKAPTDLIVGAVHQFEMTPPNYRMLAHISGRLGQRLMVPPNVKGWPGGTAWITADTLLIRQQLLTAFTRGGSMPGKRGARGMAGGGIADWIAKRPPDERQADALVAFLLPIAPTQQPAPGGDPGRTVRQILLDPAYQLK